MSLVSLDEEDGEGMAKRNQKLEEKDYKTRRRKGSERFNR